MKILYLNSFARSGETLLLRCLNQHRDIKVLHQLLDLTDENKTQYDVFKRIKKFKPSKIKFTDDEKRDLGIQSEKILLVKNGIFEVRKKHNGFILIRNPFSVYSSYKKISSSIDPNAQMKRWANNIDKNLLPIITQADLLDALCSLYVRKMGSLKRTNQTVMRYEEFVSSPETQLRHLLKNLKIDWDNEVLTSHLKYTPNDFGHGGMKLNQPIINDNAMTIPNLSEDEIYRIYAWTSDVLNAYGYNVNLSIKKIEINAN